MLRMTNISVPISIAGLVMFPLLFADLGAACSRILWNTNTQAVLVARSMDWSTPFGDRLVLHPRGIHMQGWPGENPATWISRYGSITVVPYEFSLAFLKSLDSGSHAARNLDPLADGSSEGMNEKGLAAHLLALEATEYGKRDTGKPRVHPARLLRYVLDNFSTVKDAVAALQTIQVVPLVGETVYPQHMALDDATGDSAIVEFLDGRMEIRHGREHTVLTNDPPYPDQQENLKRYAAFGGAREELPGGVEPLDRFVRAATFLKTLPEPKDRTEAVAYLNSVIRNVSVPFGAVYHSLPGSPTYPTWWTAVSDLKNRIFFFHLTRSLNAMWVRLDKVDFAAGSPRRVLDPGRNDLAGDVTNRFEPVPAGG